jgi:hypothetical protein
MLSVDAELFAQMHNVLDRSNGAAYRSTGVYVCGAEPCEIVGRPLIDQTLAGLPRVPSLGFRAWF